MGGRDHLCRFWWWQGRGRHSSAGIMSVGNPRHNTDMSLRPLVRWMIFLPGSNPSWCSTEIPPPPPPPPGADSLNMVSIQPTCATVCINICTHIKNPKPWQPYQLPLFGHRKILHTLIGMGSAALAAAVPYMGQVTQSSHKGQWSTYKKEKRKKATTCAVPKGCKNSINNLNK